MAENRTARANEVERRLAGISRMSDAETLQSLQTDPEGLNPVEAAERLEEYGKNIIDTGNENSLLKRL